MRIDFVQRVSSLATVLTVCGFAGCTTGPETAPVAGVVTLDDKPLADIRVTFQPQARGQDAEAGVGSTGVTGADGRFVLRRIDNDREGAVVASHLVTFSDMRAEEVTKDVDAGPDPKPIPQRLPAKYATESLPFDVKSGEQNEAKFELKSGE